MVCEDSREFDLVAQLWLDAADLKSAGQKCL